MSASPSVAIGRGPIAARLSAAGLDRGSIRHAVRSGRLTVVVLFLPPALLLFTLFVVIPVMEAGWYSAFNWNGYGRPTNWVGWQNYVAVVQTRAFALALRNNGLIILVSLLISCLGPHARATAGGTVPGRRRAAHAVLHALCPGRDRHRTDLQLRLRRRLRPLGRDLPRASGRRRRTSSPARAPPWRRSSSLSCGSTSVST